MLYSVQRRRFFCQPTTDNSSAILQMCRIEKGLALNRNMLLQMCRIAVRDCDWISQVWHYAAAEVRMPYTVGAPLMVQLRNKCSLWERLIRRYANP